jgi:hypothetical protein
MCINIFGVLTALHSEFRQCVKKKISLSKLKKMIVLEKKDRKMDQSLMLFKIIRDETLLKVLS